MGEAASRCAERSRELKIQLLLLPLRPTGAHRRRRVGRDKGILIRGQQVQPGTGPAPPTRPGPLQAKAAPGRLSGPTFPAAVACRRPAPPPLSPRPLLEALSQEQLPLEACPPSARQECPLRPRGSHWALHFLVPSAQACARVGTGSSPPFSARLPTRARLHLPPSVTLGLETRRPREVEGPGSSHTAANARMEPGWPVRGRPVVHGQDLLWNLSSRPLPQHTAERPGPICS